MHNPSIFSYAYILKRLCTRVFISHTICTSASDMSSVDTYHLAKRSRRSLIYTGVDEISKNMITKEAARSFIYRRLGVSFTKNIRIVGMIMRETKDSGAEYFIDMAYLADLYKNLTNTIFIILHTHPISEDVQTHIDHMGVDGICFVIGSVHNPEQYMHAFDIYVSPRTYLGDMYTILRAMYAQVSCIATKVGDTLELQQYVSAPLVPATSAKYLTEALMYVIDQHKQSLGKINTKTSVFPKKFTQNVEKSTTLDIYKKIFAKRKRA
jgi:tRNA-dihydrouridine synthase